MSRIEFEPWEPEESIGKLWHAFASRLDSDPVHDGARVLLSQVGGRLAVLFRGLGGDPDDDHSRYIEADIFGLRVASIYLPNGNPQPGPKFDYKLRWFDRLIARASDLMALEIPIVLAGDYNVIPTDADIANPRSMVDDALMQPESRAAFRRLSALGLTDALEARHPGGRLWTFWDYQAGAWQRDAGFRIDHLMLSPEAADRLVDAGVDKAYRALEKASDHAPTWIQLRDS